MIDNDLLHARAHTRALNVLIACEESQAECLAFLRYGANAYSCDLQKARYRPDRHIMGDVRPLLHGGVQFTTEDGQEHHVPSWDLIVAHPPCTYLCKVGSPWLYVNPDKWVTICARRVQVNGQRWQAMKDGRAFFYECLQADADYVAVENPLPMACAQLPKPSTFVQPSWFGCKYTKKTLFWLRNLPPLMPEIEHPNPREFVRASRGKYRSRTFPQVADAMARQWLAYIIDEKEGNSLAR